jgi:hypothetical protein
LSAPSVGKPAMCNGNLGGESYGHF